MSERLVPKKSGIAKAKFSKRSQTQVQRSSAQRRKAGELDDAVYFSTLKIDRISNSVFDLQARRRGVSKAVLLSDLLNCWLAYATDYDQAIFKEMLPAGKRAADVPERYPGYLASLGFAPAMDVEAPLPPPDVPIVQTIVDDRPVAPPKYIPGATLLEQAGAIIPVSNCWCGQSSQGGTPFCGQHQPQHDLHDTNPAPPAYLKEQPSPQVGNPVAKIAKPEETVITEGEPVRAQPVDLGQYGGPGAGRFDAAKHAKIAGAIGQGNGAQSYDLGFTPGKKF